MNWFKMFTEARNDAKLRSLTDAQHRTWFRLLCYAAEQDFRGKVGPAPVALIALEVADGNVSLLEETCNALQTLQCVTWSKCNAECAQIEFCAFTKRQMRKPSDDPEQVRQRVSKHRSQARAAKQVAANGRDHVTDVTPTVTRYKRDVTRVTPIEEMRLEENTPLPPEGESDDVVRFGRITLEDRFDIEEIGLQLRGWRAAGYHDGWIKDAFMVAKNANVRAGGLPSYIASCLRKWKAKGGPDAEQVRRAKGDPTPEAVVLPANLDIYGPKGKRA